MSQPIGRCRPGFGAPHSRSAHMRTPVGQQCGRHWVGVARGPTKLYVLDPSYYDALCPRLLPPLQTSRTRLRCTPHSITCPPSTPWPCSPCCPARASTRCRWAALACARAPACACINPWARREGRGRRSNSRASTCTPPPHLVRPQHALQEVFAKDKPRMSISGWYHAPQVGGSLTRVPAGQPSRAAEH